MSARGARKRFLVALQREAEATGRNRWGLIRYHLFILINCIYSIISNRFGVDELKEMLAACGGKSMPFFEVISALNTHGENFSSTRDHSDW